MIDLEMIRSSSEPLPSIELPQGYSIISINEDNGYIWEEVMDASWGNHEPGDFRYCIVANNGFEDERIFVLLDENSQPVATSSPWDYGMENWYRESFPEVTFIGVIPSCRGRGLGALVVTHSLHELKKRGYTHAHLGIRGTVDGENYPAVKTYINCGFTPFIDEEQHVELWKKVYSHLALPAPDLRYEKPNHPVIEMPHPPRPWPYQIRCAYEAHKNGDTYVFGKWCMHNMYLVDDDRYIQLKPLIMQFESAYELISTILEGHVESIYINHPRNPEALLLMKDDGYIYQVGTSADERFTCGTLKYLSELSIAR